MHELPIIKCNLLLRYTNMVWESSYTMWRKNSSKNCHAKWTHESQEKLFLLILALFDRFSSKQRNIDTDTRSYKTSTLGLLTLMFLLVSIVVVAPKKIITNVTILRDASFASGYYMVHNSYVIVQKFANQKVVLKEEKGSEFFVGFLYKCTCYMLSNIAFVHQVHPMHALLALACECTDMAKWQGWNQKSAMHMNSQCMI